VHVAFGVVTLLNAGWRKISATFQDDDKIFSLMLGWRASGALA